MAWTKAKTTTAVAVGVILVCGATFLVLRARSAKYHALLAHAYSRSHVSNPAYQAMLENLRENVWPKERELAEAKQIKKQR